jgi:hypothetical protein
MTMEDLMKLDIDTLMKTLKVIQDKEQMVKDALRAKIYSVEKPR